MVTVTPEAKKELKTILDSQNAKMIRIFYGGIGWGGPKFDMTLEKSVNENDQVFDQGDFTVVISKDFDGTYSSLEVDFINSFMGKGFTIKDTGSRSSGCC